MIKTTLQSMKMLPVSLFPTPFWPTIASTRGPDGCEFFFDSHTNRAFRIVSEATSCPAILLGRLIIIKVEGP